MGIFEAVADVAIGAGTTVIEDVVNGVVDIGQSVTNNLLNGLMTNPIFLVGLPVALGLLIIIVGKNTKVGIWTFFFYS